MICREQYQSVFVCQFSMHIYWLYYLVVICCVSTCW